MSTLQDRITSRHRPTGVFTTSSGGPATSGDSAFGRGPRPSIVRDALAALALSIAAGIGAGLCLGALVLLLAGSAAAAVPAASDTMTLHEATRGSLLIQAEQPGRYRPAPGVRTDVAMQVTGLVARVRVSQKFHNPASEWVDAVYVFPLPENAAVDRLRMQVGERSIVGEIREREQARAIHQQARAEGRKSALLEQERPNIFTSSVANVGPGEDITVEIEYQQTLRYDQGSFRLRFPLVVAPRYIPGTVQVAGVAGSGWSANTDAVPDAARITPPVPRGAADLNPVSLSIRLDPGFPLRHLEAPHHRVRVAQQSDGHLVTLDPGPLPADRDFELDWTPDLDHLPQAALFTEEKHGKTYALLMVMPPQAGRAEPSLPREVILVIDTSGSMHGGSLEQARAALLLALERLKPRDRFNVIQFNSRTSALFPQARPADGTHLRLARDYVAGLRASGGTEMAEALDAALVNSDDPKRVRQVIFMTDGAVGNEEALYRMVGRKLGDSRLFTVGIGSAPNSFFMTKAARLGRGTFTTIGDLAQVQARMAELFSKLESPLLTHLTVQWPGDQPVEMWPRRIPDLYLGEPVVVSAILPPGAGGQVMVNGIRDGGIWGSAIPLRSGRAESGIAALWARHKIGSLMDALREGADADGIRKAVIEVALAHRLVSRYTSLVAVDTTPTRPAHLAGSEAAVPVNLPAGWSHDAVFGLPRTATPAPLHFLAGLLALALALLAGAAQRRRGRA